MDDDGGAEEEGGSGDGRNLMLVVDVGNLTSSSLLSSGVM
jgi:hypothetical protein